VFGNRTSDVSYFKAWLRHILVQKSDSSRRSIANGGHFGLIQILHWLSNCERFWTVVAGGRGSSSLYICLILTVKLMSLAPPEAVLHVCMPHWAEADQFPSRGYNIVSKVTAPVYLQDVISIFFLRQAGEPGILARKWNLRWMREKDDHYLRNVQSYHVHYWLRYSYSKILVRSLLPRAHCTSTKILRTLFMRRLWKNAFSCRLVYLKIANLKGGMMSPDFSARKAHSVKMN
jgi:hypothetical protein